MTPAARLQTTLDLLNDVASTARPADAVIFAFFRARRKLDDSDRGAILELLDALLRHWARIGWWLARQGHGDTPRNRLLAWLVLAEGRTPDQLKRLFNGAKGAPAALTEREGALVAGLRGHTMIHPDMPEAVRLECPDWAIAPLRRRFGPAFAAEMAATLTPPPLDLRVNSVRTTRAAVLRDMQRLGLDAEATPFAPHGIRLRERLSLARLPGLKTGEVEIQDEGSQLVAMLVDARPGARVVDFCAGAGGKTLAIAAQMNNKGRIVACDVSEGRLKRGAERFRRAGVHNAETRLLASETDKWVKRHKGGFDRVLVDAPCTGTGTWRRRPDAKWRLDEEALAARTAEQDAVLAEASKLVRPGGRLIYVTCSLFAAENRDRISEFLNRHAGFALGQADESFSHVCNSAQCDTGDNSMVTLTPKRTGTDGFFVAALVKA